MMKTIVGTLQIKHLHVNEFWKQAVYRTAVQYITSTDYTRKRL